MTQGGEPVTASGLHPLGDALGVRWCRCANGEAIVRLVDAEVLDDPDAAFLALAVAADLAASSSARSVVASGARVATTSLMLMLSRSATPGGLQAAAWLDGTLEAKLRPPCGFSSWVSVTDSRGHCATGVVGGRLLESERPLAPLPWEPTYTGTRAPGRSPAPPGPVSAWLLDNAAAVAGRAHVTVSTLTRNRIGHLQGGATVAIADVVARSALPREDARLRTATWSYRAPVATAADYECSITFAHRSAHAWVHARESGRLCGVGTLEYDWREM